MKKLKDIEGDYIEYNNIYDERELEEIPFDRNGCYATGYECLLEDGIYWSQYINEEEGCYEYYN